MISFKAIRTTGLSSLYIKHSELGWRHYVAHGCSKTAELTLYLSHGQSTTTYLINMPGRISLVGGAEMRDGGDGLELRKGLWVEAGT